ncbi:MAG: phosphate ABC transporter permease PstA [Armatimonadetes bacterium]|nr:phosphate ABC transporter permease PstA [Armatimonadota bacterium]
MRRRAVEEGFFRALMVLAVALVVVGLLLIMAIITAKGVGSLSWEMITQAPQGGYYLGKSGGVLNAILGSLALAVGATALASIFAFPVCLYLQQDYAGQSRLASFVRTSLDLLWGIPSIVYGAFGFTVLLYLGMRASLLGGMIALTLVELPIMARAMEEAVRMVSQDLKEASYAMGGTRWETMRKIVLRQALPGILTAVLLAFGRGIGDAASVLFTAGYTDSLPRTLLDPVASLPLAVFFQLGTPFPEVQGRAHASAFILLVIVLIISVVSRMMGAKVSKYSVR